MPRTSSILSLLFSMNKQLAAPHARPHLNESTALSSSLLKELPVDTRPVQVKRVPDATASPAPIGLTTKDFRSGLEYLHSFLDLAYVSYQNYGNSKRDRHVYQCGLKGSVRCAKVHHGRVVVYEFVGCSKEDMEIDSRAFVASLRNRLSDNLA